jgi:hypothetical protein
MSNHEGPSSGREGQLRSAFTTILEQLCQSVVGGLGAGLVDEEGECVDLASPPVSTCSSEQVGAVGGYGLKLAAAHWQIVMRDAARKLPKHGVRQLWVTSQSCAYLMVALHAGYVLVLLCCPDALPAVSGRAVRQCEVELSLEAGWPLPAPELPVWKRVGVALDGSGRPEALRLDHRWHHGIEVLGRAGGLASFERGFRVRADAGAELDLVRDPAGFWYAGGSLDALASLGSRQAVL